MSEPRVTITLGRSGQVVKRGVNGNQNNRMVTGRKRYFEERPWATDEYMARNKRKWGDNAQRRSVVDRLEGPNLGQNDLRLKLMHKRSSKRGTHASNERRNGDPHEAVRQWENSGVVVHRKAELDRTGKSRSIPSDQIAGTLYPRDSLKDMYSSPVIDESRRRSSDRTFGLPELLPPRRSSDGIWKTAPAGKSVGSARAAPLSNDGLVTVKTTQQSAQPAGIRKPSISLVPGTTSKGEELLNVSSFLKSLGLEKYAITLQVEEVDMATLRQMGDKDLKELGIPMGPRKKILLALMPKARRQLPQLNVK